MERKVAPLIAAAVTFVAAVLFCAPAAADDYGPKSDIAAIRHDLPQINALEMSWHDAKPTPEAVTSIVAYGDNALAEWHITGMNRIYILERTYGKWWRRNWIFIDDQTAFDGRICDGDGPTSSLLARVGVEEPLIALAAAHLPAVETADRLAAHKSAKVHTILCQVGIDEGTLEGGSHPALADVAVYNNDYRSDFQFAKNDAQNPTSLEGDGGGMPTLAESWAGGGNIYFKFSRMLKSTTSIHVEAGSKLWVEFPFALGSHQRYGLLLRSGDDSIAEAESVENLNQLNFVLPEFVLKPNEILSLAIVSENIASP